ncbi:hypothetical protein KVR01_011294 [Diaporthe batatas]|uniref:uncharacterized protein n=1 Tax=Diaporthe batatas TaxID=748121 RepID=UPI001D0489DA|nr:uncharacterized protein KVR01_011294 [Diaporthe batatas]KAG8158851.1 hypothetical protein KVR01_011294 [Diaporthe batatas]
MLSLMRPQSSWACAGLAPLEPPSDLQRNCTVSPRAESRSLACFILDSRGQARLTSTSPRPTPSPTPHSPYPPASPELQHGRSFMRSTPEPDSKTPYRPGNDMCLVHRGAGGAVAACTSAKGPAPVRSGMWKSSILSPVSRGSDVRRLHEITARPFTGEQVNRPPLGEKGDK